jgi:hypothetical protein
MIIVNSLACLPFNYYSTFKWSATCVESLLIEFFLCTGDQHYVPYTLLLIS